MLTLSSLSLNKCHRLIKPDIGTVTVKRLFGTVAEIGVVKIVIAPIVRRLTDTAAAVVECLIKASVVWTEGVVIAEMPFPEHTGFIAVASEDIRHRDLVAAEERTSTDGMPHACRVAVVSRHNARTRWGTGRSDV